MNHESRKQIGMDGLRALGLTILLIVIVVGAVSFVRALVHAAPPLASTKEVPVAAAAQITLISSVEIKDIKLTSLGMVTLVLEDNAKTVRDYAYTVTMYIDGVPISTASVIWAGAIGPTPQQRIIPLFIPEGTLNWVRITAVVTP